MKTTVVSAVAITAQILLTSASSNFTGAFEQQRLRGRRRNDVDRYGAIFTIPKIKRDGETAVSSLRRTRDIGSTNWRTLAVEDFQGGLGLFDGESRDASHHIESNGRKGVVRLQRGVSPSIQTNTMKLDRSESVFRVVFSFHGMGIEDADSFCLDYSFDDGSSWNQKACWNSCEDFRNHLWYDDETVDIEATNAEERLSIRFRTNGGDSKDDILIDKVTIRAS